MTPEERADQIIRDIGADLFGGDANEAVTPHSLIVQHVASAIRAAEEAEREACAKVADEQAEKIGLCGRDTINAIAAAIRARSKPMNTGGWPGKLPEATEARGD